MAGLGNNFITGLVIGQNHSTRNYQAAQEWREYAESLQNDLKEVRVAAIASGSDALALTHVLSLLDPETKAKVERVMKEHYVHKYVQTAVSCDQGFEQNYAVERASSALRKTLEMIK